MLAWMLYAVTVSLLLAIGANCAARSARLCGAPVRFIWAAALLLSLLIPAVISSVSVTLPKLSPTYPDEPPRTVALRDLAPKYFAPALFLNELSKPGPVSRALDHALTRLCAALSMLLATAGIVSACLLEWRKRGWSRTTIAGMPVLVAQDAGPAIAGLLFRVSSFLLGSCMNLPMRSAKSSRMNAHISPSATRTFSRPPSRCW